MTNQKLKVFKSNDEIDLKSLFRILLIERISIILITSLFAIASVIFALQLPNTYSADTLLAPTNNNQALEKMQGLSNLVGITGPIEIDETTRAIETLKSRFFINNFAKEHKLIPMIIAMEKWDFANKKPIYDAEIYDPISKQWLRETDGLKSQEPNNFEIHEKFMELLNIEQDIETNFIKISLETVSPEYSHQWLTLLINDINKYVRDKKVEELNISITYLEEKIRTTQLSGIRDIFYNLVQENIQKKLLAETQEEYIFQTIDPSLIPQDKSGPSRAIICIIGTFLGGCLALIFGVIRYYKRK